MNAQTSVIIPVRNGRRFISDAIRSVLEQLGPDDEIIIIDDASTDDTRTVVSQVQDPRIKFIRGAGRGVSSARNIGLTVARGELVAFLDHDDLWPPRRHLVLRQALIADSKVDCAIGRIRLRVEQDAILLPAHKQLDGLLGPNSVIGNALFRRRIIDVVGGFDESMQFCEDIDYYVRLDERKYRFVLCDVDALTYRRHSSNLTCDIVRSREGWLELMHRKRLRESKRVPKR